jgi:anti-sigma B factor antagonist
VRINERFVDEVAVLEIRGQAMGGPQVRALDERVGRMVVDGVRHVVVDLSRLRWCGAAFVGALLRAEGRLRGASGNIALSGLAPKVESVLTVTRLAGMFRTYETAERAAAALRPIELRPSHRPRRRRMGTIRLAGARVAVPMGDKATG